MITPTVKVKPWGEGQGDYVEINVEDFNPEIHDKYEAEPAGQTVDELKSILTEAGVNFAAKTTKGELLKMVALVDSNTKQG